MQTNYDHALPMPPWDDRKRPAEKAMKISVQMRLPGRDIQGSTFIGSGAEQANSLFHVHGVPQVRMRAAFVTAKAALRFGDDDTYHDSKVMVRT